MSIRTGQKETAIPGRPLWALILLAILINAAHAGSKVALPLFAIQLGASTFTVGVLMAAFALVPALFALRIGRILDRVGPRRPMIISAIGVAAGLCAAFVMPGLPTLFASSVMIGTFGGLFFMAHTQAIGKLSSPENRTAVLSMSAVGYSASSFIGPMVAGAAIDGVGHAVALLLLASGPAAALVALQFRLLPLAITAHPGGSSPARGKVIDFFRDRVMRQVYVTGILSTTAWECLNLMVPIYGHSIGLSATSIGIILGSFAVGTFAIRMALPVLARRLSAWRLLGVAFSLCGTGYALVPFTTSAVVLVALAFGIGLGLGISQPMVTSIMFETAPPNRIGEALGLRTALVNVGQTTFPLALGGLGTLLGIAPVFWGVAAIMAVGVYTTQRLTTKN